ncbi:ferredoxin [Amycolatopsis sp. A1MSW2902]|uniref:ferredoxin n=1 Tax=Amycolatopsis sp. A1MSW2902 TaxID=687413 RepID=UPI00307D697E
MHVKIDDKRCIAAGQCVLNAPQVFDQRDEDGIVELLDENPPPDQHNATRLAARLCPAEVILLGEE